MYLHVLHSWSLPFICVPFVFASCCQFRLRFGYYLKDDFNSNLVRHSAKEEPDTDFGFDFLFFL